VSIGERTQQLGGRRTKEGGGRNNRTASRLFQLRRQAAEQRLVLVEGLPNRARRQRNSKACKTGLIHYRLKQGEGGGMGRDGETIRRKSRGDDLKT